ncbi:MAG: gamma carbonic anhydrase family protein [Acidobacteria bacterium]|nr:MAG: gamma carbonic anhydrase family protein [Acidobacteriota bacterium]
MIRAYQGHSPRIAETAYVAESAVIIGRVEIGENASVWFGAVLRGDIDPIRVGANSNVQDGCVLHTMAGSPTIVGDWVTVGHRAVLHGCRVEDHCLIGMAAVLLNDVVVGEGSIVAAGAVVAEKTAIPPGSLYLGVPARLHRALKETDLAFIDMHAAHYLEYKEIYLNEMKKGSPAGAR